MIRSASPWRRLNPCELYRYSCNDKLLVLYEIGKRIRDTIQSLERICCLGARKWSLSVFSHPCVHSWSKFISSSSPSSGTFSDYFNIFINKINILKTTLTLNKLSKLSHGCEEKRLSPQNPISYFVFMAYFKVTYFLLPYGAVLTHCKASYSMTKMVKQQRHVLIYSEHSKKIH